jgi:hypothetical protein
LMELMELNGAGRRSRAGREQDAAVVETGWLDMGEAWTDRTGLGIHSACTCIKWWLKLPALLAGAKPFLPGLEPGTSTRTTTTHVCYIREDSVLDRTRGRTQYICDFSFRQ